MRFTLIVKVILGGLVT